MKVKQKAKRVVSGLLTAVTLLSTVLSPISSYAAELPKERKLPLLEEVQSQLDEDEIVLAKDHQVEVGTGFDVKTDFTGLEIKDAAKVKITFEEAKNEQGEDFTTCVIVCYAIAICLDMFRECTVLLLLFFSLRSFVGGLHMSSFNACFVCSCTVVSLILIMVKYCSLPKVISVFISACGIAIIFFLKPVENKNRPTEEKERKLFSHRTRLILLLTVLSVVLFYFGGFHSHLMTVTYTLVAIIISMFLGRIKNAFEIS